MNDRLLKILLAVNIMLGLIVLVRCEMLHRRQRTNEVCLFGIAKIVAQNGDLVSQTALSSHIEMKALSDTTFQGLSLLMRYQKEMWTNNEKSAIETEKDFEKLQQIVWQASDAKGKIFDGVTKKNKVAQ